MVKLSYRTCFAFSTLILALTCLCCAVQGLLLVVDRTAPPADPAALARALDKRLMQTRQAHEQITALWQQLQAGQPAACTAPPVVIPAIFVLRPAEADNAPSLGDAARQLNRAIDRIAWAVEAWSAGCAAGSAQAAARGLDYLNEAGRALDEAQALLNAAPR
ncbi:MAG: hypothetical protein JXB47_08710 [Anaerolineae bacterium]|nr:hypothetical protein [Anaerolineae bacterium]